MRIQLNETTSKNKIKSIINLISTEEKEIEFVKNLKDRFNNKSSAIRIEVEMTIAKDCMYIVIEDKEEYIIESKVIFKRR